MKELSECQVVLGVPEQFFRVEERSTSLAQVAKKLRFGVARSVGCSVDHIVA
jgi:hypothetical protein